MSYNFSFADNGVYSAADVNKITSRLVTSGIEDPFTDGVPYNLSAINEAGTLLYTDGAVPETVNTLKVVKAEEEGTIFIYPGTAFFSDGSVIEIEAGGETLSYTPGAVNYVYLKNDLINTNTSYPVCTTEAPEGIYVALAEISETGEITDKRTYAKGKLPWYSSSAQHVMQIVEKISVPKGTFYEQRTYDIGDNAYRFLVVYQKGTVSNDAREDKVDYLLGIYDFATGEIFSVDCRSSFSGVVYTDISDMAVYRSGDSFANAIIAFSDGKLTLDIHGALRYSGSFSFTLYLF